jgi:predicted O-methyltransferase YrrM
MNQIQTIIKILISKIRLSKNDISIIDLNKELLRAIKTKPIPLENHTNKQLDSKQFLIENNKTNSIELFTNKNGERYPSWITNDENLGDDWLLNDSYYPLYHQIYNSLGENMTNPKLLEIGVRTGYSAIVFAKALKSKCKYIGIDPNIYIKEGLEITKKSIKILQEEIEGFESILIQGYSSSTNIQSTINLNGPYEFIHIDGEHTYLGKLIDLYIARNNITRNGFVLVDDVSHHKMIQDAISVSLELGWFKNYTTVKTLRGLAILK